MANKKKKVYKPKPMTEGKRNIIQGLLQEYDIETAEDVQNALKDLLSGTLKEMLEGEMDEHLGYEKYNRSDGPNYRNGTRSKRVRSQYGEFEVDIPQDRNSSFEPKVVPKRQKDISSIENKIISMYAKGMTTRLTLPPPLGHAKRKVFSLFYSFACFYWLFSPIESLLDVLLSVKCSP